MHQHSVDKEVKKKEKSSDWHPSLKKLVRFAASLDGIQPAQVIPLSYRKIINASMVGHAKIELLAQLRALGHKELEWDLPFVNALRHGTFESPRWTPQTISPYYCSG
jgi:hypothetical protein